MATNRNTADRTPPPRNGSSESLPPTWPGIEWSGASRPAFLLRAAEAPAGEFGAFLAKSATRPTFIGVDLDETGIDPQRAAAFIIAFRKAFLAGTLDQFRLALQPQTSDRPAETESCPLVPIWVVIGTALRADAVTALGEAGAFVIDRDRPQGKALGSWKAVTALFTRRTLSTKFELPPLHIRRPSDEDHAAVAGYPPGIKQGDLQAALDRARQERTS